MSRRLGVLLAVMVGLVALRWWSSQDAGAPVPAASAAVVRPGPSPGLAGQVEAAPVRAPGPAIDDLAAGTREPEDEEPGNAFAVPVVAVEAASAPPPEPPKPPPFVGPLQPSPPAPPPFPALSVIGSWRDDGGGSVFIAAPQGVLQGRVGDILMSEYRITQITSTQVFLRQIPSNREIALAISAGAGSALNPSK